MPHWIDGGFLTGAAALIALLVQWLRNRNDKQTEISRLVIEDNEGLREREAQWQAERAEMRAKLDTLEDRVNILERELRVTQLENIELRAENKKLRADYAQAEERIDRLKTDLAAEKARTTRLTDRVRTLERHTGNGGRSSGGE